MPQLPQRTVQSLLGTEWTRRSDGHPVTVVAVYSDDVAAGPDTRIKLSSQARTRTWHATYSGLVNKYTEDSDAFAEELTEIATGGALGQN